YEASGGRLAAETQGPRPHLMEHPRLDRSVSEGLCCAKTSLEREFPRAPSRADDERALEQSTQPKGFSPAARVGGVLLDPQERIGCLQQASAVAALPLGPRGEVGDGAMHPGRRIS